MEVGWFEFAYLIRRNTEIGLKDELEQYRGWAFVGPQMVCCFEETDIDITGLNRIIADNPCRKLIPLHCVTGAIKRNESVESEFIEKYQKGDRNETL